ncbi:MAG: hypothetical protein INH41_06630 [Myxococcaceae bacterium]|jgi:hypothetical protein|nr:hypothetical protein [Myxococcaceae bacterium]MCA3012065.1 hypothetical protein [Myxococcaceae bacterium]
MSSNRAKGLAASLLMLGCLEWPLPSEERLARDEKRFPKLSVGRPLGSPCGPRDAASVRRAPRHPLGPSGAWLYTAVLDVGRTIDPARLRSFGSGVSAALMPVGKVYAGYVLASVEGALQARTYDDVYGEVYGGWSPSKLEVSPASAPVFVALARSFYGDGELRQVHEVCWTPEGAHDGVVVFSTAHEPPRPPFERRHVVRSDDLGGRGFVDSTLALGLFDEHLRAKDGPAARALVEALERRLSALPGAVHGSTGVPIPAQAFNAQRWAEVLAVKAGLAVGTADFDGAIEQLERIVTQPAVEPFCHQCRELRNKLPLLRWLGARASGQRDEVPDPARLERGPMGDDPVEVANLLLGRRGPSVLRSFDQTAVFWGGVKAFTGGDPKAARAALEAFLRAAPRPVSTFEGGAATALLESLREAP